MIDNKKVKYILERCDAKSKGNDSSIYIKIAIASVFLGAIAAFPGLESSILLFIGALFLSFLLFFVAISLFYFLLNETLRIQSVKALNSVLCRLEYGDWDWIETSIIYRPKSVQLHSTVIRHPVALFILGKYFLHKGYQDAGNYLVSIAICKVPKLKDIEIGYYLSSMDSLYLQSLLRQEKKFRWVYLFQKLWNKKLIRYLILFFTILVVLIHYFAQLLR